MHRLEDPLDRLGLTVGPQDRRLLVSLRLQDRLLTGSLRLEDAGLTLTLGVQDRRALVAVGPHLLLHRLLDGGRRVDRLDLDPVDPDPPLAGGLVQDPAQSGVDLLAGGQGALQVHGTDDVAQRGDGELVYGLDVVGDLVGGRLGLGHLVVEDGVYVHHEVVLGDHRLRPRTEHLFTQVELGVDAVDPRDDEVQSGVERPDVATEALDVVGARLRNDPHRGDHEEHHEGRQDDEQDFWSHGLYLPCESDLRVGRGAWPAVTAGPRGGTRRRSPRRSPPRPPECPARRSRPCRGHARTRPRRRA